MDLAQKRAFLTKLSASKQSVQLPSAPPWHESANGLGRIPEPAKRKSSKP